MLYPDMASVPASIENAVFSMVFPMEPVVYAAFETFSFIREKYS